MYAFGVYAWIMKGNSISLQTSESRTNGHGESSHHRVSHSQPHHQVVGKWNSPGACEVLIENIKVRLLVSAFQNDGRGTLLEKEVGRCTLDCSESSVSGRLAPKVVPITLARWFIWFIWFIWGAAAVGFQFELMKLVGMAWKACTALSDTAMLLLCGGWRLLNALWQLHTEETWVAEAKEEVVKDEVAGRGNRNGSEKKGSPDKRLRREEIAAERRGT